jgi:hypothetical protein
VIVKTKTHVHASWVLPFALLALPNCGFSGNGPGPAPPVRITPGTTLVPCDIRVNERDDIACAGDGTNGVRLSEAAIALVEGLDGRYIGIDDSPAGQSRCPGPVFTGEAIPFHGPFPAGMQVCVDPATVGHGRTHESAFDVCVAKCLDLMGAPETPDDATLQSCRNRAVPSTNVLPSDPNVLFANGCTTAGMPNDAFMDPRESPEPIFWVNPFGVDAPGTDLVRNLPCSVTPCTGFDTGAASAGTATRGDGYVEFSVSELDTNRMIGLTRDYGFNDHEYGFTTVEFGIDFYRDGCYYVFESGARPMPAAPTAGCAVPEAAFGHYASGDRFRISFSDNFDGTAKIEYAKLPAPCTPGSECPTLPPFLVSSLAGTYPLHVDAVFEDYLGRLVDVRLVYIH